MQGGWKCNPFSIVNVLSTLCYYYCQSILPSAILGGVPGDVFQGSKKTGLNHHWAIESASCCAYCVQGDTGEINIQQENMYDNDL
jgi:hypothetical protein